MARKKKVAVEAVEVPKAPKYEILFFDDNSPNAMKQLEVVLKVSEELEVPVTRIDKDDREIFRRYEVILTPSTRVIDSHTDKMLMATTSVGNGDRLRQSLQNLLVD